MSEAVAPAKAPVNIEEKLSGIYDGAETGGKKEFSSKGVASSGGSISRGGGGGVGGLAAENASITP